jgi:tRNA-2-methylthio-N6-dimethylallyladenosine synthase
MNSNDTSIVKSILANHNIVATDNITDADIIFLNTCSVRENAEDRVFRRIDNLYHQLKSNKTKIVFGILGCMAERLQEKLFDDKNFINLVVGPDEYKKLPELIEQCFQNQKSLAIDLSTTESYEDIIP